MAKLVRNEVPLLICHHTSTQLLLTISDGQKRSPKELTYDTTLAKRHSAHLIEQQKALQSLLVLLSNLRSTRIPAICPTSQQLTSSRTLFGTRKYPKSMESPTFITLPIFSTKSRQTPTPFTHLMS